MFNKSRNNNVPLSNDEMRELNRLWNLYNPNLNQQRRIKALEARLRQ